MLLKKIKYLSLILALACQKQQKISPINTPRNLQSALSPTHLGLGNLQKPVYLNLQAFEHLPDADYTLSVYLGAQNLHTQTLHKDWGWYNAQWQSLQDIALSLGAQNLADGKHDLRIVFQSAGQTFTFSENLAIERYVLRTEEDLWAIEAFDLAGNYRLGADITLTKPFKPIAMCSFQVNSNGILINNGHITGLPQIGESCKPFSGTLNGQNFSIKNLNSVNYTAHSGVGLFGIIYGKNAWVKNITLEVNQVYGENLVGALAGFAASDAVFSNIQVFGKAGTPYSHSHINGTRSYVGGVFGLLKSFSDFYTLNLLQNIKVALNIDGGGNAVMVGGVAGTMLGSGKNLYFASYVPKGLRPFYIIKRFYQHAGGLVGYLYGNLNTVNATADLEGANLSRYVGGLVGTWEGPATIYNAYHSHYTEIESLSPSYENDLSFRKIQGTEYVGGLIGQLRNIAPNSLVRVYVDSQHIQSANEKTTFVFSPQQENLVYSGFYGAQFAPQNFQAPQKVYRLDKTQNNNTFLQSIGFTQPWQFPTHGGFPFL